MVLKNGTGTRLVKALEVAWHDIQKRFPELPDVVMITGSGRQPRSLRLGHYWHAQWEDGKEIKKAELFIAGETIALGHDQVMSTMLHEAAHALARVREVQDVSSDGMRHTTGFKSLAEELGLEVSRQGHRGWAHTELTDETRDEYSTTIKRLEKELDAHRAAPKLAKDGTAEAADSKPKKSRNYLKTGCGCGNTIRMGRALLDSQTVGCAECEELYVEL